MFLLLHLHEVETQELPAAETTVAVAAAADAADAAEVASEASARC